MTRYDMTIDILIRLEIRRETADCAEAQRVAAMWERYA